LLCPLAAVILSNPPPLRTTTQHGAAADMNHLTPSFLPTVKLLLIFKTAFFLGLSLQFCFHFLSIQTMFLSVPLLLPDSFYFFGLFVIYDYERWF
jgi:hypothetical protein